MKSFYGIFRPVVTTALCMICAQHVAAQGQSNEKSDDVDIIVNSILSIRDAGIEGDSLVLDQEIMRLAKSGIDVENESMGRETASGVDHDFMRRWEDAVTRSDSIKNRKSNGQQRGTMGRLIYQPRVTTRRFYLKKGESNTITTNSRYKLSVAVVPERGGLVTMRMHASNRHGYDRNFDDTEKFHQGKSYRKRVLDLPEKPTEVEIEVINRSPKNISYILITQ